MTLCSLLAKDSPMLKGRDKDDLARARAGIWKCWRYFGLMLIVLAILGFAVWYVAHFTTR